MSTGASVVADTPLGYYKWYPRDFYSSPAVRSMSFMARAIYRELLDLQWESVRLPDAKRTLSALNINDEQWQEFAPYLDELFPNGQNPRLKELRETAVTQSQKNKESGSKGGRSKRTLSECLETPKPTLSQTETETETETNKKENKEKKKSFVKPTALEVASYMTQRGWISPKSESERFVDYYQANGWKVGKNPMKDWQSAVRSWESRNPERIQSSWAGTTSPYGDGFGTDWGFDPDGNKEAYTERGERLIQGEAA